MQLQPEPFGMIKSGVKTIELRLFDEKRRKIRIGDEILFSNTENGETLAVKVLDLSVFDSFEEFCAAFISGVTILNEKICIMLIGYEGVVFIFCCRNIIVIDIAVILTNQSNVNVCFFNFI
jgi:hypothetical protein